MIPRSIMAFWNIPRGIMAFTFRFLAIDETRLLRVYLKLIAARMLRDE